MGIPECTLDQRKQGRKPVKLCLEFRKEELLNMNMPGLNTPATMKLISREICGDDSGHGNRLK